ncbi:hypothetical protein M426DRAFT_117591 [Hypoxylon sp. CI-4A]|nr:hypothetical protein M426DRAFT_117591 [Hypoxylon sp. CI-4A]
MASVPYEIIAASKPFRFLVGPDKKEFTMHSELVARMSKPLRTMVNGDRKDSKDGLAELSEVDEETFVRFCEFAYTGDYQAAEPTIETPASSEHDTLDLGGPSSIEPDAIKAPNGDVQLYDEPAAPEYDAPQEPAYDAPPEPEPEPVPESGYVDWVWGATTTTTTTTKKKKKRQEIGLFPALPPPPPPMPTRKEAMWTQFEDDISDEPDRRPKETPNTDPLVNYSEVLLSHARLYALADCYAIDALAGLCLRKLHRTLKVFKLHGGARATDVTQLIDYAFKNTANKNGEQDPLRSLLATYAACHIETLWSSAYFQDVLESGEISKAFIGQLLRRVN